MAIFEIDDLIKEIELNISSNNNDAIREYFKKLNNLIEGLIETNQDYYEYYKYQYHYNYSSFLRVTGNTKEATNHETFSKRYEVSYIKMSENNSSNLYVPESNKKDSKIFDLLFSIYYLIDPTSLI